MEQSAVVCHLAAASQKQLFTEHVRVVARNFASDVTDNVTSAVVAFLRFLCCVNYCHDTGLYLYLLK